MPRTYQILDDKGKVLNTIVADESFVRQAYPDRYKLVVDSVTADGPGTGQPQHNRMTPLAFLRRFTDAERARFERDSVDDPNDPEDKRLKAARLRMYMNDYTLASYVRLDDPRTIAGVKGLEEAGIIAKGRAKEVLETPIKDDEA